MPSPPRNLSCGIGLLVPEEEGLAGTLLVLALTPRKAAIARVFVVVSRVRSPERRPQEGSRVLVEHEHTQKRKNSIRMEFLSR